jgi:two-component system OmpR family response regulator
LSNHRGLNGFTHAARSSGAERQPPARSYDSGLGGPVIDGGAAQRHVVASLPALATLLTADPPPSVHQGAGEIPAISLAGVRLLVVEDEARMAALLKRGLEEDGYVVDIARTGPEALRLGTELTFDAVVLDRMLPGLDGVEVCRQLRAGRRWMPVLMLTARSSVEDRVLGLDAGADDYLTKPFSFAELSARLRALIRRGAGERPTDLALADLRLQPATHRVWRGDVEIELSAKEFALLENFLRNPDQVLTRLQILENVWDVAYDAGSNIVDQYVLYLRRKIDRPFGVRQLETVRGVGYRLLPQPLPEAAL